MAAGSTRKVTVELDVDANGVVRGVRQSDGQLKKLDRSVDKTGKKVFSLGAAFNVALGTLASTAAAGAIRSIQRLARAGFDFLASSVRKAGIQDIAERKLEQALKNTGDESEESAEKLKKLAAEVQRFTNFGDEAIITAQAMLLSFGEVAGAEGAALLTTRMADMAAGVAKATGETIDLNQVAAMMGRALTTGASALKRVGVSLTDAQDKAFNAAKGLDKVRLLGEIIDSNFKGLAKTIADPFKQLQNSVGDLQEDIGRGMLPILREFALEIRDFADSKKAKDLARQIGEALGGAIVKIVGFIKNNQAEIIGFFKQIGETGSKVGELVDNVTELTEVLSDFDGNGGFEALSISDAILSPIVALDKSLGFINDNIRTLLVVIKGAKEGAGILADLFTGDSKQFAIDMKEASIAIDSMILEGKAAGFEAMFAASHLAAGGAEAVKVVMEEVVELTEEEIEAAEKLKKARTEAYTAIREELSKLIPSITLAEERVERLDAALDIPDRVPLLGSLEEMDERMKKLQEAFDRATTDDARREVAVLIDELNRLRDAASQVISEAPDGSLAALSDEISKLQMAFDLVTTDSARAELAKQIFALQSVEDAIASVMSLQALYVDSSIRTAKDAANAIIRAAKDIIAAKIGEAVAVQAAKVITTIPWPFNMLIAPAVAAATSLLLNNLIPEFRSGVTNFGGGLAKVHKDEIVALPGGTDVISQAQSRRLLDSARSGDMTSGDASFKIKIESDIPFVVRKIQRELASTARTGVGPKLIVS